MGTTIESDWENTRLLEELESARADAKEAWEKLSEQWISHAATIQKLAAEQAKNVELLDFIARAQVSSGVCCCGDTMDGHPSPMSCGHSPIDVWDHAVGKLLDAPSDTSALKAWLGEAVAWEFTDAFGTHYTDDQRDWMDTPGIESVTPLLPEGTEMTMPKFEPVATAMVNQHGTRWMHWKADLAHGTNLHSADQLTEAYEAGKQDQAAELEAARAEIERLENQVQARDAELWGRTQKILQLEQQLAAEQAKNVGLREKVQKFIDSLEECTDFEGFTAYIATMDDYHEAVEALSTQSDTSALEAIVKKAGEVMRERCLKSSWGFSEKPYDLADNCASAIRALPTVTLDDLKGE